MNGGTYWMSRLMARPDIDHRQLVSLGGLDPYGQHQALWRLFSVPSATQRAHAEFLFRADQGDDGLPIFYVLSRNELHDAGGLWSSAMKLYAPDIAAGDRFAFKLRANPTVARKLGVDGRGQRHDVVMDMKRRLGWQVLPEAERPSLASIAQEAGVAWLCGRSQRLGCEFEQASLRADGYRTWRQRRGKGVSFSFLDFEGSLSVTDPSLFCEALYRGVGPAKAFGCGLLMIRRLE